MSTSAVTVQFADAASAFAFATSSALLPVAFLVMTALPPDAAIDADPEVIASQFVVVSSVAKLSEKMTAVGVAFVVAQFAESL